MDSTLEMGQTLLLLSRLWSSPCVWACVWTHVLCCNLSGIQVPGIALLWWKPSWRCWKYSDPGRTGKSRGWVKGEFNWWLCKKTVSACFVSQRHAYPLSFLPVTVSSLVPFDFIYKACVKARVAGFKAVFWPCLPAVVLTGVNWVLVCWQVSLISNHGEVKGGQLEVFF